MKLPDHLTNTILCMESMAFLQSLPDGCVQCIVTSPPYYGKRDYGNEGQIGLEESPEEYIDRLVKVFNEAQRVLHKTGTLWINIGDSYWHTRPNNGEAGGEGKSSLGGRQRDMRAGGKSHSYLKDKDLIGIPWLLAFSLRGNGWYLRSEIIWHKPVPKPESVKDRPTYSHEQIFLLSKSPKYYYDYKAIQTEASSNQHGGGREDYTRKVAMGENGFKQGRNKGLLMASPVEKANKRDVWTVPYEPHNEEHYATYPGELIKPCILAGSRVGDVILDPFMGMATTALVARNLGRLYTGCDINPDYVAMGLDRLRYPFEPSHRQGSKDYSDLPLFGGNNDNR